MKEVLGSDWPKFFHGDAHESPALTIPFESNIFQVAICALHWANLDT